VQPPKPGWFSFVGFVSKLASREILANTSMIAGNFDRFTQAEAEFIGTRYSFYMATVSESGWPYVQHRGGPPGFLQMLDDKTLAFADFRGNLQYISLGNLTANDRAALIMVDYPNRQRLKIYARVEVKDLGADPVVAQQLALPGYRAKP
jgi:uncharacterized protein